MLQLYHGDLRGYTKTFKGFVVSYQAASEQKYRSPKKIIQDLIDYRLKQKECNLADSHSA